MTQFILCSGMARHGKDTSAEIIKRDLEKRGYSTLIIHYADLLKFICKQFFGWNGEKDEAGRTLLQRVGTNCVREQNPNYWVDFVISVIAMFPDQFDFVIVPDTRFPNEISRVRQAGFDATHIKIVRTNFNSDLTEEQKNHPSETALNDVTPDFVIENDSIDALTKRLEDLCGAIVMRKKQVESL